MCRAIASTVPFVATLIGSLAAAGLGLAADPSSASVDFLEGDGRLTVAVDGLPIAVYSYKDNTITRPFFAHVRAPGGVQVTRHHPPIDGQDIVDHGTMHPGIWMSFGDINGCDYWRLMARVRHVEFIEPPQGGAGRGSFAVRNQYFDQKNDAKVVCGEVARYTFSPRPEGYLLLWDSTFSSNQEIAFGDQEEMGIGFRVATPLRVGASGKEKLPRGGGTITSAAGDTNEEEVWGTAADWCDFSGKIGGQRVGMTIFCHPENFRPSWFHARDYGLLVANPFGRQSFGKGDKSVVVVRPGEKLRLRYGILIHAGPPMSRPDLAAAYQDYLQLAGK